MYETTTNDIKVTVSPYYLETHSEPERNRYLWAYHIVIENLGKIPVKLINRYWRITDEYGHTQEVSGEGVVGEQPHIKPGTSFEYASGTPLSTPSGIMGGHYEMESAGNVINVEVPSFSLDSPHSNARFN